ncbi:MAG TPA: GNAT family N-acetyltransferase [Bacteroidetes bacterium]|nr:GNAT family N-acetyltransferase [Bacteroidota bacterium]
MNESITINPGLNFRPVFFARYPVERLSPAQVDALLANGWFRTGLHVQSTLGRFVDQSWKPCLMLRISLKTLSWKKKLRKIMRRNGEMFEVKIRPFAPSAEVERLWQDFKTGVHKWKNVPNLSLHLFRGREPSAFNSWEVCIYKNGKLVAFSVFDKGGRSIAGLEAAYDVAYRKYSLGIYTMLVEMELGMEEGLSYYYPGFYPKDSPMFGYKMRTGNVEFYRLRENTWLPWEEHRAADWLLDEVFDQLKALGSRFARDKHSATVKVFQKNNYPGQQVKLSDFNFLLVVKEVVSNGMPKVVQVAWCPLRKKYYLFSHVPPGEHILKNGNGAWFGVNLISSPFRLAGAYGDIKSVEAAAKKMLAGFSF